MQNMKLYDFAYFARIRAERQAAQAVAEVAGRLENPGSVVELKQKVSHWFALHQEILKRIA